MTYAIGYVVYGINFKDMPEKKEQFGVTPTDYDHLCENMLESRYSGGGDQPLYLGVEIGQLDECDDVSWTEIKAFENKANTTTVAEEFSQMKTRLLEDEDLSDTFKEKLTELEPEMFVTWGSS